MEASSAKIEVFVKSSKSVTEIAESAKKSVRLPIVARLTHLCRSKRPWVRCNAQCDLSVDLYQTPLAICIEADPRLGTYRFIVPLIPRRQRWAVRRKSPGTDSGNGNPVRSEHPSLLLDVNKSGAPRVRPTMLM